MTTLVQFATRTEAHSHDRSAGSDAIERMIVEETAQVGR
jgi:hypothetical protein